MRAATALSGQRGFEEVTPRELRENYLHALEAGFITYSDEAKSALLGVSRELIDRQGAVSEDAVPEVGETETLRAAYKTYLENAARARLVNLGKQYDPLWHQPDRLGQ